MKSNIYFCLISLVLLLFSSQSTFAGGVGEFHPYGYKMYRVHDKNNPTKMSEYKKNCILWQKLTSDQIPLDDIEQVVYKYNMTQMKAIFVVDSSNKFARWIKQNNDKEIYDFLILAKICENTRSLRNNPWYYPSKNDGTYLSLLDIEEQAKAYKGKRLKDRYVLQAVRAMHSSKRYQELIEYWNEVDAELPEGLIKGMARAYLQGAYSATGRIDEALEYFTKVGDLNSLIYCLYVKYDIVTDADELEYIAKYAPESGQIPEILQRVVAGYEPWGACEIPYKERMQVSMISDYERETFDRIYNLAVKMSDQDKSKNHAAWCYTAAFLADLDAKPGIAWTHINKASESNSSEFMKQSIRVFKMYLDAKISVYNAEYQNRLYADLKWLDSMISGNITDSVREELSDCCGWKLRYNISFYYWNDVMRRILLSEVCPRMIDKGMTSRALQLANMAEYRLLYLVNDLEGQTIEEHRNSQSHNCIDYSNKLFQMMYDSVSIKQLLAYAETACLSTSDFDAFLNSRGYNNLDYIYDVVGTRYIKAMDYGNAVKYLSKVSPSYQDKLNTSRYMHRDPFKIENTYLDDSSNYKLRFATEMHRLSKSLEKENDVCMKALDMIKYATGLKNSYYYCWALTDYKRFECSGDDTNLPKELLDKVDKMYADAKTSLYTSDLNDTQKEMAALALLRMCRGREALKRYPDTYVAKYVKMACDNLSDYGR